MRLPNSRVNLSSSIMSLWLMRNDSNDCLSLRGRWGYINLVVYGTAHCRIKKLNIILASSVTERTMIGPSHNLLLKMQYIIHAFILPHSIMITLVGYKSGCVSNASCLLSSIKPIGPLRAMQPNRKLYWHNLLVQFESVITFYSFPPFRWWRTCRPSRPSESSAHVTISGTGGSAWPSSKAWSSAARKLKSWEEAMADPPVPLG